ncbi:D-galactose-binding periplasmic protein (gbp) (d-galactose/d-glucose-binding protein) (ggbp) [Treponema primitia ZAS-2]|uniref:D-galactose/methyl-galactoside binding periplasmic protein MglB n=1 Tax=Treponema primitia (strain ATCC BAA-887 / DSM 12427 / ZAS-2) TaxID=545694 RepID=F5YJF7_TREPZ|nr:galactose ABC transporter substrate-binding protein [Treponema primitia]AEF86391.1 D-galactose-binding periplasmic protein (gbp) (d-galactose/d-glucose-binding protein) (ggbp) [Treponema primitia ZAS-2]
MKKAGIALLVLALSANAVFAGGGQQGGSGGQPTIGVAIYKFDDTFMSYTRNAIENNAKGKAVVTTVDSQNAQPTQNDQVDQFISKKLNSIAINPVDRTAAGAIIDKAKAGNVPVVFFNREPFAEDMAKWDKVYYVGAKAEESGTMQGEIVAEYFKANPGADKNGDGVIQYIMLKGEPGHQDAELRTEFSVKAIIAAGLKVQLLAEDTAMWDRPRAVEKMDAFYARFGDQIEVVLCNNDDMALGVVESLRNAGFFTGGKYLPVVGVDATAPALQALSEGTLLGTVLNDAQNQGKATFDVAYALATGAAVSSTSWTLTNGKYIWVPYQKVTKDNYKNFQ